MRHIYLVLLILSLSGCSSSRTSDTTTVWIKKDLKENLFEKFPIDSWNNRFKNFEKGHRSSRSYIYNNTEFYAMLWDKECYVYIYPQKKQFYTAVYDYYKKSYILKEKGKVFGWEPDDKELKIGIWYEYNEQGELIKEIDEDKKFGKFGYNELLQFLDNEKVISLNEGLENDVNKDHKMMITHYRSDTSDKKLWRVFVKIGQARLIFTPPGEIGERVSQPGKSYLIDGNTGEVIKRTKKTLKYYKEIGFK